MYIFLVASRVELSTSDRILTSYDTDYLYQ